MKALATSLLLSLVAFFAPIHSMIIAAFFLILADMVLGVIAARKSKVPITSAGLRRTISKIFVFEGAIILCYLAEHMTKGLMPLSSLAAGVVALVELKSCIENLNIISDKDLLRELIDKLGSMNQQGPKK